MPFSGRFTIVLSAIIAGVLAAPSFTHAEDEKPSDVPLKKVVLFNSGLGFFRHEGEIDGDKQVELKFNVDDVNDLLKSMVLEDLGGGKISTVTYGSRDPITRTLKTFALDLTRNPTLAELLRQARGEKVQLDVSEAGPAGRPLKGQVTGTIVGVERRRVKGEKETTAEIDVLNLLTPSGLRSIPFDDIRQTQLLDPKLNDELQEALAILAKAHRGDKKTVTLDFLGKGKRPVHIGYVQEFPVWKTSYRLVIKDDGSLFLQGWAIVENTTEQDWNKVSLTLVSGQPISFVQDLYQPLYVERPLVVPDSYAGLSRRIYDQDLAAADADFKRAASPDGQFVHRHPANPFQNGAGLGGGGGFGGGGAGGFEMDRGRKGQRPFVTSVIPITGGAVPGADNGGGAGNAPAAKPPDSLDLNRGVASAAEADSVGELFRYVIDTPVTIARQKSAMLPIVNRGVKGEKLSIYNPAVHAKHPLNGLRLINSTGLHLMQGPITVFDGGEYAGDARIEDLQPDTERLLSYALDLDTEVAPGPERTSRTLSSITIGGPTCFESHLIDRTRSFIVKNSGQRAKKLLVEYPLDAQWTLVTPKQPAEKTRGLYRFAVTAEPGKPANLQIVEQRTDKPQVVLAKLPEILPTVTDEHPATFTSALRERTTDSLTSAAIEQGILRESHVAVRNRRYVIRNPSDKPLKVAVSYAIDPEWSLQKPQGTFEKAGGFYQLALDIEPRSPGMLEVVEQRTVHSETAVARLDGPRIATLLNAKSVGAEVKAALAELLKRRQSLATLTAKKSQLETQIKDVGDEQARIRQNMSQLDRNSELYNRYVKKFGEQEDQVEKFRQQLRGLDADFETERKALAEMFPENPSSDKSAVDGERKDENRLGGG
jgi:hypothetical protein